MNTGLYRVLVLGGYGQFGRRVTALLRRSAGVHAIAAGRDKEKLRSLGDRLGCEVWLMGPDETLDETIAGARPQLLVDCTGHVGDYNVANACIASGVHYVDIADNRRFVCEINTLDEGARAAGVTVISGASTVPGLSSSVVAAMREMDPGIDRISCGVSPGNRTERGLATVGSVLAFVGQDIERPGLPPVRGWHGLGRRLLGGLGKRWFSYCDCADWVVVQAHFRLSRYEFKAGLELGVLHLALWLLAWLVRAGFIENLARFARPLKWISDWFLRFGTDEGGMYVAGSSGHGPCLVWELVARKGDGPYVPAFAAVAIVRRLARGGCFAPGAYPCVDILSLREIVEVAAGLEITFVGPVKA